MGADYDKVKTQIEDYFERLKQAEKSTDRISNVTNAVAGHYERMSSKLGMIGGLLNDNARVEEKSRRESELLESSLTSMRIERSNLQSQQESAASKMLDLQTQLSKMAGRGINFGPEVGQLNAELSTLKDVAVAVPIQLSKLSVEISKLETELKPATVGVQDFYRNLAGVVGVTALSGLTSLLSFTKEFGKATIDANSNLERRNELLQSTLRVQFQTGVETSRITDLTKALVEEGLDLSPGYEETLKVAAQLSVGIGLSAKGTAELAVVARATNQPFRQLADTMANIVNNTSLAADEAARYYTDIAAAARASVGAGGQLDPASLAKSLETVGMIETRLKGLPGVPTGEIEKLLTSFSGFDQKGGLGLAFGTGGIDFLNQAGKADEVLENLAKMASTMDPNTVAVFSAQLGLSKNTLTELGRVYREAEKAGKLFKDAIKPSLADQERITIEKRYQDQLTSSNEALSTLSRQFESFLMNAFQPFVPVITFLNQGLIKLVSFLGGDGPILTFVKTLSGASLVAGLSMAAIATLKFLNNIRLLVVELNKRYTASQLLPSPDLLFKRRPRANSNSKGGQMVMEGIEDEVEKVGSSGAKSLWSKLVNGIKSFVGKGAAGAVVEKEAESLATTGAEVAIESVGKSVAGTGFRFALKGALGTALSGALEFLSGAGALGTILEILGTVVGTITTGGWGLIIGGLLLAAPYIVSWVKGMFKDDKSQNAIDAVQMTSAQDDQISTMASSISKSESSGDLSGDNVATKLLESIHTLYLDKNETSESLELLRKSIIQQNNQKISAQSVETSLMVGTDASVKDKRDAQTDELIATNLQTNKILQDYITRLAEQEKRSQASEQTRQEQAKKQAAIERSEAAKQLSQSMAFRSANGPYSGIR